MRTASPPPCLLRGKKSKCPKTAVFAKRQRVAHMFNHGWWRWAVGSWQLVAVGGWKLAVGNWRLVAVGGLRLVVVGGWQWAVGGGWRSAAVGGWLLTTGGWWGLAVGGWRLMAVGSWPFTGSSGRSKEKKGGCSFRTALTERRGTARHCHCPGVALHLPHTRALSRNVPRHTPHKSPTCVVAEEERCAFGGCSRPRRRLWGPRVGRGRGALACAAQTRGARPPGGPGTSRGAGAAHRARAQRTRGHGLASRTPAPGGPGGHARRRRWCGCRAPGPGAERHRGPCSAAPSRPVRSRRGQCAASPGPSRREDGGASRGGWPRHNLWSG